MMIRRPLAVSLYLSSAACILIPLADAIPSVAPFQFWDFRWRYAAVGILSNALLIPTIGLFMASLTAALMDDRRVQRALSITCWFGSGTCVMALVVLGLDSSATFSSLRPEVRQPFLIASYLAFGKFLLMMAVFTAYGWANVRRRELSDAKTTPIRPTA